MASDFSTYLSPKKSLNKAICVFLDFSWQIEWNRGILSEKITEEVNVETFIKKVFVVCLLCYEVDEDGGQTAG